MTQYEYRVVSQADVMSPVIEDMLNRWGQDGWELINVTGGPTAYYYFFKRKVSALNS